MKNKLIKLLLNHEFYQGHKHLVIKEMFPDFLGLFYDALAFAHGRYKRTLKLEELGQIIYASNPMLTEAQKSVVQELLHRASAEDLIGEDVAGDVLKAIWKEETGRRISKAGLDLIEGKGTIQDVQRIVEATGDAFLPKDDVEPITTDVGEVLSALDKRVAWRFNIPSLNAVVPGISEGEFAIFFARVEAGKTAFWVSSACGPEGFLAQGAKILVIANEEPAIRTMMRCISAASGMTKEQIKADPAKASKEWDKIRSRLMIVDDVSMTLDRLNNIVKIKKPDILIADQIDKLKITGNFMRTDQELGAVYGYFREITKINHCAGIGITQASDAASGRTVLHLNMMAESKTSKPAEADLIIGIGKAEEPLDDPVRFLSMPKNKISGFHGTVNTLLKADISRFIA